MKTFFTAAIIIAMAISISSCDKLLNTDGDPVVTRSLIFKYALIPEGMTDITAIAQMRDTRSSILRNAAIEKAFPTTDEIGFAGAMVPSNRIIVTQEGSSSSGSARLLGGQNADVHPYQDGIPSSLLLDVFEGDEIGTIKSRGDFEIRFGTDTEAAVGHGDQGDFMEFTLDSYNTTTKYATGRFMFIAHNTGTNQRWAIFDGQFALTEQ